MNLPSPLRVGLIGLDTSHAVRFTEILHGPDAAAGDSGGSGGRVVAAYPGGSADMDKSVSRVAGFRDELAGKYGVAMLDSPEAVAERVDLLLITAVDGRAHPGLLERTLPAGRPTFVDKPFALTTAAARRMFEMADAAGVAVASSSALRFADPFAEALGELPEGEPVGVDAYGPLELEPTQPGLFWYGIHVVEMLVAALGPGVRRVTATSTPMGETVVGEWGDGRVGTLRAVSGGHRRFGAVLHTRSGPRHVDASAGPRPFYVPLLERVLATLPRGRATVPPAETLAVVAFIEAANRSRATGAAVEVGA